MATRRYRFESIDSISAGATGTPGKRTFYLLARDGRQQLRIQMEKQLLQALSLGIQRLLLEALQEERQEAETVVRASPRVNPEPGADREEEFQAREVAVGYDQSRRRVGIFLYEAEGTSRSPTFAGWGTKAQMEALSKEIDEVCAAGRPLCFLCQQPIDPEGNVCPRSNGHGKVTWA